VWKSVISDTATRTLSSAGEESMKSERLIGIEMIMMMMMVEEVVIRVFYLANILFLSQG
jgi:hypothetical protein